MVIVLDLNQVAVDAGPNTHLPFEPLTPLSHLNGPTSITNDEPHNIGDPLTDAFATALACYP